MQKKYPLLQLDYDKRNDTKMYTEKKKKIKNRNEQTNRLINKLKNQTICSTNIKGGTRRKPIGFVIKP